MTRSRLGIETGFEKKAWRSITVLRLLTEPGPPIFRDLFRREWCAAMARPPVPWVFFPLQREASPFRRLFRHRPGPKLAFPTTLTHHPFEIGIAITGEMNHGVLAFLDQILDHYPPAMVVLAGFAGSLAPHLNVGDLMVAEDIVNESETIQRTTLPIPPFVTHHRGRLFTSSRIIGSPREKHELGQRLGASAVDMEASLVAQACAERRIPFGCVRAISDGVDTELSPDLLDCLAGGRVSFPKLVMLLARRPTVIRELLQLQRATNRAAKNLAQGLLELLTSLTAH